MLLDDPRWLPIAAEHKLLAERHGDPHLAALELNQALTDNKVRCLGRFSASGKRELVPSPFWADYELSHWSDGLKVTPRRRRGEKGRRIIIPLRGVVLYVWKPDVDKLWRRAEQETEISPQRRKPGPQPRKNWKLYVAAELHRIVEIEGKQPPVAADFAQLCEDKLGYQPDIREVQRLLRQLL
jgi:hypothetical protein